MNSRESKQSYIGLFLRILFVIMIVESPGHLTKVISAQDMGTPPGEETRFTIVPIGEHPLGYFSDVSIAPGESADLNAAVVNTGSAPVELRVYATNAGNASTGGFEPGYLDDEPVGPTLWIELEETVIELGPDEEHVISLTVTVPIGAEPGQYIAALVAETAAPLPLPGSDVLDQIVRYSISIGVLVPGEIYYELSLGSPIFNDHILSIPISNNGNYLVRPEGELTVTDDAGNPIVSQPLQLGSIYGGNEISLAIRLPSQIPSGEYHLSVQLYDPDSGASARLSKEHFEIPEPEDPTGVYLREHSVEPNSDPIVFANVSISIDNGGQQLNSVDVTLIVLLDGVTVDEFPLATNQTFISGENTFVSRYLPEDMWMSGSYTFRIEVFAVEPNSGQRIELLVEDLDSEIVVP